MEKSPTENLLNAVKIQEETTTLTRRSKEVVVVKNQDSRTVRATSYFKMTSVVETDKTEGLLALLSNQQTTMKMKKKCVLGLSM